MIGMSATTGRALAGDEHLAQSVRKILWTRIGSRVGRRDFGSLVPDLVDQPMNGTGRLRLYAAVALALSRWETRLRVAQITLTGLAGAYALRIEGNRTDLPPANARTVITLPLPANGSLAAYA